MDCQQAEATLSLWVGSDLDDADHAQLLHSHLEVCPRCRRRSQEFVAAHTALQEARVRPLEEGLPPDSSSLWPRVKARLVEWESRPQFAKFNVWVPTVVATAACSVLVLVALVELQRKMERWSSAPSLIAQPWGAQDDLFRSDPMFASSRGRALSRDDLERWQGAEFRTLRPAGNPNPYVPFDVNEPFERKSE